MGLRPRLRAGGHAPPAARDSDPSGAILGRAGSDATPAERAADFIRATLDRTAAYSWPPAAERLAAGQPIRPTRAGWRAFFAWRSRQRVPVDLRAVEVELARAGDLFGDGGAATEGPKATEGLTVAEFAAWAGIDRRRVGRHIVVVPPGPVPPLPEGAIPARRVGRTIRIFKSDSRGVCPEGDRRAEATRHPPKAPSPAQGTAWDRQVAALRLRRPPAG